MALPQTLTGVRKDQVGILVQAFIDRDGAARVTARQEVGGATWTIHAE